MADSFALPLRPLRQKAEKPDTLPLRIAQINAQRGSFRDVTEQGLLEEIEAQRISGKEEAEPSHADDGEHEAPDKEKELFTSRAEMIEFAMQAHAEATYALDYVSLALSKFAPRQAEMSMSQYLKFKIPQGSLDIDRVRAPEETEAQKGDINAVSRGWTLESFDSAADKLLQAATRLEEEVAAETKYRSEILAVKEKGWKVCRLPQERQTLGVQFGFLEATNTFRDRGLAALRRGDNGSVILDQGIHVSAPRVVRFRVQQNDRIMGSSVPTFARPGDDLSLEPYIHQARDTLFEEELFYELHREARALLRHGVETRENQISFSANDSQKIIIDLIGIDEATSDIESESQTSANELAGSVATSTRILLTHAHRKNRRRRTQPPPPLSARKRPTLEYPILRPSFSYLQHRSHFQWLSSFLNGITGALKTAGLECTYSAHPMTSINHSLSLANNSANVPPAESFVDGFIIPQASVVSGRFLSPACGYKIIMHTDLNPTGLGTGFEVTTNLSSFPPQQKPFRFGSRDDVHELLLYLFTLDLAHTIPSLGGTKPILQPSAELVDYSEFGLGPEEPDPDEDEPKSTSAVTPGSQAPIWEPTFAQRGELAAFSSENIRTRKLRVEFNEDALLLRCFRLQSGQQQTLDAVSNLLENEDENGGKVAKKDYVWRRVPGAEDTNVPLKEALEAMEAEIQIR